MVFRVVVSWCFCNLDAYYAKEWVWKLLYSFGRGSESGCSQVVHVVYLPGSGLLVETAQQQASRRRSRLII